MSWFKRDRPNDDKLPKVDDKERRVRTEGLWQKCESCRQIIWKKDLEANWNVCPKCGLHGRLERRQRPLAVALAERHGAHGGRDQVGGEGVQVARQGRFEGDVVHRRSKRHRDRQRQFAGQSFVHRIEPGMRPGGINPGGRSEAPAVIHCWICGGRLSPAAAAFACGGGAPPACPA